MAFNWTCPRCGAHTTLQSPNFHHKIHDVLVPTATVGEGIRIKHFAIKCPSPKCGLFTVDVEANYYEVTIQKQHGNFIASDAKKLGPVGPGSFRFEPRVGQPLSKFVPGVVNEDYEEACMIRDISPKAAATLCRRALQGMIRDFWKVSKGTLAAELITIESQCEPELYAALMALKGVGNIGAHPERDINLIVDVEPGEVDELLELLRILDSEWYVAREARKERLASVAKLGLAKNLAQKPNEGVSPAPPSET